MSGSSTARSRWIDGRCSPPSVTFTIDFTVPFEIITIEQNMTGSTLQAFGMESTTIRSVGVLFNGLEIVALDSIMTGGAQRPVALMVMLRAEGTIIENVEISCLERRMAFEADETTTVISPCKATIGG